MITPKPILKKPTVRFPENPVTMRVGVAPHKKDVTKDQSARWTKIDRRLVNPAALEGQERYEERNEFVIVLRVLTEEQIQAYANRTQELRGM